MLAVVTSFGLWKTAVFSPTIFSAVSELHYAFDMKSIEEADEHYRNSPY